MEDNQIISFKKNQNLFQNEEEALNALRSMKFTVGEPIVAMYGPSWGEAKLILAIGKRTAAGDTAFDIIATSNNIDNVNIDITELQNKLTEHEDVLANGETPGHVMSGRNITFINGYGYVNQLSHKLTISGTTASTFDGSQDVTVDIPLPSDTLPLQDGSQALAGTSLKWARADHVHPAQKDISGNAGSASKLDSQRTINITGAVTGTAYTDLSSNVVIDTAVNHNHTISDLVGYDSLIGSIDSKASLDSPAFTGIPTAPTPEEGTSSTQIATTEFVVNEVISRIEDISSSSFSYRGTLGTSGNISSLPDSHMVGDIYLCITGSPEINGKQTSPGDIVICTVTSTSASDSDWTVLQGNIYTTITPGNGLTGGGNLEEGNVTISHATKPSSGTSQGGSGTFVSSISTDDFGHISEVNKLNFIGRATSGTGKYLSEVWIDGNEIKGNSLSLPSLSISGGEEEVDKYVTGINNLNGNIVVTKKSLVLPEIDIQGGEETSGQYISGISASGHLITVTKQPLQESGTVKVDASGSAGYLETKLDSSNTSGNIYGVDITKSSDKLLLGVQISEIDGNEGVIIKPKRSTVPGDTGADSELAEGEIFVNINDNYIYVNTGNEISRLYQNATQDSAGLMSAADKTRLDNLSLDVGDIGSISSVINELRDDLENQITEINNLATEIEKNLSTEINNRTNEDIKIRSSITNLDNIVVKKVQLGEGGEILEPTSGTVVIPIASDTSNGLMSSDQYTEIYTNIPNEINSIKSSIDSYTVNSKAISSNPVLNGGDIVLTGYVSSEDSSSDVISSNDSVNIAFSKLQRQMINEISNRNNGDNELRSALEQEITNRTEADTTLQNNITAEITNRTEAISSIRNDITNIQEQLSNVVGGADISDDLKGTHYLEESTTLLDALKALDSKLYEIEQSMLSSVLVKTAD